MSAPSRGSTRVGRRSGRTLRKLTILITASLVTALVLEWAVGRYFPVGGQIYTIDSTLLHDALPHAARIQPMEKAFLQEGDTARVLVETGAQGFRGADLEEPKTRKRILVLGDSLVMAENVPEQRTFVRALGRELEARIGQRAPAGTPSIEMVNAGRSGYGPDQALLLFERDGGSVNPDLVIFVLCAHNDFGDLMRNKLFRLDGEGALVQASPIVGERIRAQFQAIASDSSAPALLRLWRFWRSSGDSTQSMVPLPAGTMRHYATALEAQAREHVVARNPEVVSLFEDVYDIDVAADLPGSFAGEKRALMAGVLSRMVHEAAARGIPLLFVVVPSAVDMCENFGVKVDVLQFPGYQPGRLVEALVGSVGLAGGVAIDATPALAGAGAADRYFVGGTDMHWNAAGQAAAASYVSEELLRDRAAATALGVDPDR